MKTSHAKSILSGSLFVGLIFLANSFLIAQNAGNNAIRGKKKKEKVEFLLLLVMVSWMRVRIGKQC
ncbi:MAG: hypothetical protein WCL06_10960 [Bacteroidota bacterium]